MAIGNVKGSASISDISFLQMGCLMADKKPQTPELTAEQHDVLRCAGTERPFTSPLLKEKRDGLYACAGCGAELFRATTKFDSGTGWPSFYEAIPGRIATSVDHKIGVARTEYHCAACGGHQGHVFEDGPLPTGLRYCNNGVALTFKPKDQDK